MSEPISPADIADLSDEEVLALRAEIDAAASQRLLAMNLRAQTAEFADQAKALGRTRAEVEAIVSGVLDKVYAETPPEPEPDPTPEFMPEPEFLETLNREPIPRTQIFDPGGLEPDDTEETPT